MKVTYMSNVGPHDKNDETKALEDAARESRDLGRHSVISVDCFLDSLALVKPAGPVSDEYGRADCHDH